MRRALTGILLSTLLTLPSRVPAAPGDLDGDFGAGGTVVTDVEGAQSRANDVLVDPSGRIVAAGTAGGSFAVVRWTGGGVPDPDFGGGDGVVRTTPGPTLDGRALVRQSTGRLVVGGNDDLGDFLLTRFEADGSSPTTISTHFAGVVQAFDLLLDPGDALVLAGFAPNGSNNVALGLLRYGANGALDGNFGTGGFADTDLNGLGSGTALVRQTSGAYVAITARDAAGTAIFGLARFTGDGMVDGTFGVNGVATAFAGDQALGLTQLADGTLLAVGTGPGAGGRAAFAVARFTAEGQLDPNFGTGGVATATFAADARATAVVVEADGRIVAGGYTFDGSGVLDFALARFAPWGAADATFGIAGQVVTSFGNRAGVHALALQTDGQVVAVGEARVGGLSEFSAARYELGGPPLGPPPPVGGGCATVADCRTALAAALPSPLTAATRKARLVARGLGKRAAKAGRAIDAGTAHTGKRQAKSFARARRVLAGLGALASRADGRGTLGVVLAPITDAVARLVPLLGG